MSREAATKATEPQFSYVNRFGEFHIKDGKRTMAIANRERDAEIIVLALEYLSKDERRTVPSNDPVPMRRVSNRKRQAGDMRPDPEEAL